MEKLLKENSTLKNVGTFVAGAAAMKLMENGCGWLTIGVVAFVVTTLWIVKSVKAGKGNLTRKAKLLMVALATVSTISLVYGVYHKLNCHNIADQSTNEVMTEDNKEEEPVEEPEEPTEEVSGATVDAGEVIVSKTERGYCPVEDRIQATYESNKETAKSDTKVIGNETLTIISSDNESKKQDEEIAKDVENGKEKVELSNGIVATKEKTTDKTTEEKSANEEEKTTMDKTDAVEVKSEEDKKENNTEEKKSDETKVEEVKPSEASDDELDAMLKTTETIEDLPKIDFVEVNAEVFPKEDTKDVEEKPADEIVEEVEQKEKAVEVKAIDGFTGSINSTMQFQISGDNIKIDGLDGLEYTFSNGYLNIQTGSEATILTIEISNSVSSVTFDVIVNGIVK